MLPDDGTEMNGMYTVLIRYHLIPFLQMLYLTHICHIFTPHVVLDLIILMKIGGQIQNNSVCMCVDGMRQLTWFSNFDY
jgi:hypothetical protein